MAAAHNIPRDIQDSIRDVLDRRIKISIKRMVKQEVRADKTENRVLAFSPCRLFVLAAKVPSKVEHTFHFLDIQALESKKINQLSLTVEQKVYTFTSLDPNTDDVNHMITHIGVALKQIFPAFPLERLIVKVDVTPPDRLRIMNEMIKDVECREMGPCGGFTTQYACMCDYHSLPYREEVAWDVDTIYLSQDSRELCLRDFDHLSAKDQVPIISALEHNSWFTGLNASNIKLTAEAGIEVLKVMRRNAVIEELNLANTGVKTDFIVKLSTALLSNSGTQLSSLDVSGNMIEDRGVTHLLGTLKSLARGLGHLDLSHTGATTRCLSKMAETLSQSQTLLASLQTLKLADNGQKGEDMGGLYMFLAQPNVLTTLDLSGTDCAMDNLCSPLLLGCPHLTTLNLARTVFTHKRTKDVVVPVAWKQYFTSTCSLQSLDVSGTRLPPEAVKELLLGIASNRHVKGLHLDLSSNELGQQGAQHIAGCIGNITGIGRLDISNNNFDNDMRALMPEIAKNTHLKHLAVGRNFSSVKPKHMWTVLEYVVQVLQEEDSVLESLSLADSKLKQDTACVINALGSNTSLREIDLSGNQMGDYGARMLSKALQINTHLCTVVWDRNGVSAQGFEDVAEALEKNFTLKKMPFPVNDAAAAMRLQSERTEAALQKVERLLQRNHSPRKLASDQQYRLQQGFLISSTQQMVDRLCVQVQDSLNALKMGNTETFSGDLQQAEKVVKDADNSKQLLPKLQEIAMRTQDTGNTLETTLQTMTDNLRSVMEQTMQKTVEDMLDCTATHCEGIMTEKAFKTEIETGCKSRSALQKDFTKLVLDGVSTDVYNKLSELNLAVAAYISDSIIDEVITKLSDSHKGLTNHLNLRKSRHSRDSAVTRDQPEKADAEKEKEESADIAELRVHSSTGGSPKLSSKRKSVISRKLRPQSVLDEVEDTSRKKSGTLEKVAESQSKESTPKGSTEHLDELPELQVQKLEHLNKARPRRTRTHAPKRPVAQASDEASDDGINMFYTPTPSVTVPEPDTKSKDNSKGDASPRTKPAEETIPKQEKKNWLKFSKDKGDKDKDKKEEKEKKGLGFTNLFRNKGNKGESKDKDKDKEKEKEKKHESLFKDKPAELPQKTDTSKVYTRTSKAESPKANRADSSLSKTPPAPDTKPMAESPKLLLAPRASEESLDDELEKTEVKSRSPGPAEIERKDVKLKRVDSEREEEERSEKTGKQEAKSSSEDDWEKVDMEEAAEAGREDTPPQEPEAQVEEKPEEPAKWVPKGLPKIGFSANVLADLKAQQEKRSSQLFSSPEDNKETKPEKEAGKDVKTDSGEKEETNNNLREEKKEESVRRPKPADSSAAKVALLPPKKEKPSPEALASKPVVFPQLKPPSTDNSSSPRPAPRALLPPKKPLDSASAGDSAKATAPATETSTPSGLSWSL